MLKLYIALQLQRLFGVGVGDALGAEHHADTPGGNLRVGQHDYHKRRHHDAVHRQCDILDYRKDVAAADAAQAVFHAPAAYPHDKHRRHVHQRDGQRRDESHADIRVDDVVGHDMRGLVDALMLARLAVEGADNADAVQAFADNVVLLVDVAVGDDPQRLDLSADHGDDDEHDRHEHQHDQREHRVLAHGQQHAAEKQHRYRHDAAGEHRRDP